MEKALGQLADDGSQSDQRFAESLLRRRIEQGYGYFRIRAELRRLGIDDASLDISRFDWDALLDKIHRKKYGERKPASANEVASRQRFLLQRGFSAEQIHRLLRQFDAQHDHFD